MRRGKRWALNKHSPSGSLRDKAEQLKASVRAKVEHPFRVLKRQFGLTKVRCKGLAKSTAQLIALFALSHVRMARRHLQGGPGMSASGQRSSARQRPAQGLHRACTGPAQGLRRAEKWPIKGLQLACSTAQMLWNSLKTHFAFH